MMEYKIFKRRYTVYLRDKIMYVAVGEDLA